MLYVTIFGCFQGYTYVIGGRWWTYFAVLSVTLNDASAYFAGKLFGRHKLLRLSPNKTVEGFLGGLLSNVLVTYYMAVFVMDNNFWKCPPKRLNYGFFEEYQCDKIPAIYLTRTYQLPLIHYKFDMAPAVIYTIIYALYASVFAPFVGFFASGFKRATGVKDFSNTLPGHGGIMDRMDCISVMCWFNYFFLTQVILRDETMSEEGYERACGLDSPERQLVVNTIAERLALPQV